MSEVRVTQVAVEVMSPFETEVTRTGIGTERFDNGNGTAYFVAAQIADSGDELRSKTVKSIRVTSKRTNSSGMIFGYDINDPINMSDLENGTRSDTRMITAPQSFPDSAQVTQSKRKSVNISNAVLWTVRIEGDCTGETVMDRIDKICVEVADQGARR